MKASQSMSAYWLASIRRFAAGATLEGVTDDDVLAAVLEGIKDGHRTNGDAK